MQNLFHIDFPKFEDFFQAWFIESIPKFHIESAETNLKKDTYNLIDVINPNYYNYKNIDWTQGKVFIFWHAPLIPLPIHSDIYRFDDRIKLGHAVSFNLYNTSTVNFYDINDLQRSEKYIRPSGDTTPDLDALYNKFENTKAIAYDTDKEPIESHNVGINDTYIMNTITPHQLLALPNRINVSVRCSHFNDMSWDSMVDFFKDSIKD